MNLADIYAADGIKGLTRIAQLVDVRPKYLYQLAKGKSGRGKKRPSPELAWRLVEADPRIKFEDLYAKPTLARQAVKTQDRRGDA